MASSRLLVASSSSTLPMRSVEPVYEPANAGRPGSELVIADQGSCKGAFDPMLGLICRASREEQESQLVGGAHPAERFCDVCANRVCGAQQLHSHSPLIKGGPRPYRFPKV